MNAKLAAMIGLATLMQTAAPDAGVAGTTDTKPADPPVEDPNALTKAEKVSFFFKSKKEKDVNGSVVMVDELNDKGEKTGKRVPKVIPAPEPITLELPLLTLNGIIDILQREGEAYDKARNLIVEACNTIILDQVRSEVNDDVEGVRKSGISADVTDFVKIAGLPPAQRRGSGIPDEVWEAFIADYTEVMQHHGKSKEKAETGAKLLAKRFQPVKSNKKVVQALKDNLQTWFANTEKGEELQAVYESLAGKADQLLAADEEALVASI